jgi:Zn-dependent peptidase ImmA (M78 family)/DNA-binding XRE family transcriptional regulator
MFSPSRLRIARHRRAWTKADLSRRSGISLRSITEYEAGRLAPGEDRLALLARILQFPIDFFTAHEIDEPSADNASFRALSSMTAAQRHAALAAGALAIELAEWLDRRFVLPEPVLPDLRGMLPEEAAQAVRRAWGIGEKPIRNLVHLLELSGVRVFSLAEHCREVDAFSLWRGGIPYVFLNTQKSPEHGRFDAAHEVGHLVLHRHGHGECESGRHAEDEANLFASALLMPRGTMLATTPRVPSLAQLVGLKRTWRVSLAALIHRLHRIGLLSDWQYKTLCIEISRAGYRTREPDGLEERETSQVLVKALAELRRQGMGRIDVARSLRVPQRELEGLLFGLTMSLVEGDDGPRATSHLRRDHLRLVD